MSSSPASLSPCHIQPHTIRQGWAEIEDKQAGGLGTNEEGRKVAGTWEKTKHRQGGPYLKTGSTQWGPAREKTLRELIAPSPHQFVFLLEMWVHGRTTFCGAGAALHVLRHPGRKSLSHSLPGVRIQPHTSPAVLAAILVRPRFTSQRFETSFLLQLVGKPPGTTKRLHAVRMGGQGLQSQDRGTWARLRGKMSSVCLLAVDGQRGALVSSVMSRRRLLLASICPALSEGLGMTICLFSDSGGSECWRLPASCLSTSWQEGRGCTHVPGVRHIVVVVVAGDFGRQAKKLEPRCALWTGLPITLCHAEWLPCTMGTMGCWN